MTLNYGVRWDIDHLPKAAYEAYYKAFQPHMGLANRMLSERVVLRAGAGVYQGVFDLSRILFSRILGENPALGPINPAESKHLTFSRLSTSPILNTVYGAANFIGPEPREFNDRAPAP